MEHVTANGRVTDTAVFRRNAGDTREEQIMFRAAGVDLYGVMYHPSGTARGAVVLCGPDGEERYWSQRTLVTAARYLAQHCYAVLRFDFMGQGESGGEYAKGTFAGRIADIKRAVQECQQRTRREEIALLGVRLGANCALLAGRQIHSVQKIALWAPVADVHRYIDNLLRINVSTQLVVHKRVVHDREALRARIISGETVSANGYALTRGLIDGISTEMSVEPDPSGRQVLSLVRNPQETGVGVTRQATFPEFWREPRMHHATPKAALDTIVGWLNGDA